MRTIQGDFAEAGRTFAPFTVNISIGASASAQGYAEYTAADEDPPPSTWPVLMERATDGAQARECGGSYTVMIVDADDVIRYHAVTSLTVPEQRAAFVAALAAVFE